MEFAAPSAGLLDRHWRKGQPWHRARSTEYATPWAPDRRTNRLLPTLDQQVFDGWRRKPLATHRPSVPKAKRCITPVAASSADGTGMSAYGSRAVGETMTAIGVNLSGTYALLGR